MKKLMVLLLIALQTRASNGTPSLQEVRALYEEAVREEASCKKLLLLLQPYSAPTKPLLAGYKACATMVMARHVFNPFRKLSYFSKGKQLLEEAIGRASQDIELRFLRFTIQTNVPSFLGYTNKIQSDKQFLLNALDTLQDDHLKQTIISYMERSTNLALAENKTVRITYSNGTKTP